MHPGRSGIRLKAAAIAAVAWAAIPWSLAAAWPWSTPSPQEPPHPAVARIIALDLKGASLGSGTLVAVNETHGLVVTNWHVVRDARGGAILVLFPDGFASPATVLKTDRDWDLAALAIWRPRAIPVAIAQAAPRPGEWLAIAGYGQGQYRTVKGVCTQYLSPSLNLPRELVELRAAARQGDSGGPIFNSHGELVGVLFGSGDFDTMGAYCGRVRAFLTPLKETFYNLPAPQGGPQMLAAGPPSLAPGNASIPAVAASGPLLGQAPPLERIKADVGQFGAASDAATISPPSTGSIPLTAVAASELPGSRSSVYGTFRSNSQAGTDTVSAGHGTSASSSSAVPPATYGDRSGERMTGNGPSFGDTPAKPGPNSLVSANPPVASVESQQRSDWRPDSSRGHIASNTQGLERPGGGAGWDSEAAIPGNPGPSAASARNGVSANSPIAYQNPPRSFADPALPRDKAGSGGPPYPGHDYGWDPQGRSPPERHDPYGSGLASSPNGGSQYGYNDSADTPHTANGELASNRDTHAHVTDAADRSWDYRGDNQEGYKADYQGASQDQLTASIDGSRAHASTGAVRSDTDLSSRIPSAAGSPTYPNSATINRPINSGSAETSSWSDRPGEPDRTNRDHDRDSEAQSRQKANASDLSHRYQVEGYGDRSSSNGWPSGQSGEYEPGNPGGPGASDFQPQTRGANQGRSVTNTREKSAGVSDHSVSFESSDSSYLSGQDHIDPSDGSRPSDRERANSSDGSRPSENPGTASGSTRGGQIKSNSREGKNNRDGYDLESTTAEEYASAAARGGATVSRSGSSVDTESDDRRRHAGDSSGKTSGTGTGAIPPMAVSSAQTEDSDGGESLPYEGTSRSAKVQTGQHDSQPAHSGGPAGIGIETLLGLIGLLILFVQSMRWLGGFYERSHRRRRDWRTPRRRPYYERNIRPVYRSYW